MASSAKKTARKPARGKLKGVRQVRAKARPTVRGGSTAPRLARKPDRRTVKAVKGKAGARSTAKAGQGIKAPAAHRHAAPARAVPARQPPPRNPPRGNAPQHGAPRQPAHAGPLELPGIPRAPTVPGEPELRITDEAVAKATGRDWNQWCEALDAVGARNMAHSDIARLVMERFRLGPWWSQMVTVGFEQLRGLRVKHQKSEGFEISVSKTLSSSAERVYAAWNQDAERARWLGQNLRVRGATPIKTIRLAGSDGISAIVVALYPKGPEKTQVTVQHMKLKDAAEAARMKLHWASALNRLRSAVEAP